MTRLFNLESYIDWCQYARVFEHSGTYKSLLDKYAEYRYLAAPIINPHCSSQLAINPSTPDYLLMGTELSQGEKQRLFIIRDTLDLMTLSTSDLLKPRDGYLYSSAYHYWNHYTEIHQQRITKPLVFIDLDNFDISTLILINPIQPENIPYRIRIPVLNPKKRISFNNGYNCREIYNRICNEISHILLDPDPFPELLSNTETVNHLSDYLKKINILKIIQPYVNHKSVDLIIEIYHHSQIFYKKITLSLSDIASIVCQQINFEELNHLANQNPEYQFILASQYNIFFSEINTRLPNFLCLQPSCQEFARIWTQKNNLNFPLFAIYLDEIEFAVAIDNQQEWIKLSNENNAISYEGKLTTLIGSIPSRNQDFVRIPRGRSSASLPIKLNGRDYCINDVPQNYQIQIENYQETEEIRVQIQFNLQPGSFPELQVRDLEGRYRINTSLIGRAEIDRQEQYYSYIPPEQINKNRQDRSLSQIERLKKRSDFRDFITDLDSIYSQVNRIISKGYTENNYNSLTENIERAYKKIHERPDLLNFISISSSEPVITELTAQLQKANLSGIVDIVYDRLNSNLPLNNTQKNLINKSYRLIGKLYQFSQYISLDKLFFNLVVQLNNTHEIKTHNLQNEYLQCLARIAINERFQHQYFSLFNSQYKLENSQYLWGYGRILLWYYNFNTSVSFLKYQEHFTQILNYLVTKSHRDFDYQYKQNAFLSLIYLLTFCAHNSAFCRKDSQEFTLAQEVIKLFQDDRIILNTVSREKPLNNYFEELIKGRLAANQILDLLQG
jgi:hypothetical protein